MHISDYGLVVDVVVMFRVTKCFTKVELFFTYIAYILNRADFFFFEYPFSFFPDSSDFSNLTS